MYGGGFRSRVGRAPPYRTEPDRQQRIMNKYSIKRYNAYTDEELMEAVQKFAQENESSYISGQKFCDWFGISPATIQRRYDSWANFCQKANLYSRYDRSIDKEKLLKNLETIWEKLDRQPRAKELKQPLSPISVSQYQKFFKKSWYEICLEFIAWKTGTTSSELENQIKQEKTENTTKFSHKTKRAISLALRYDILKRDNFRCVYCGRSPATEVRIKLHVDHIIPWSKGGETEENNLETLCEECNLGKSNKTC